MKKILLIGFTILQTVTIAGCNTMAGAGEDVSHAGHAVTNEANENK